MSAQNPVVKESLTTQQRTAVDSLAGLILHLVLTGHWYDEAARGAKTIEYRYITQHWLNRIWARRELITHVRFSRGFTKTTQTFRVAKIDIGRCPIPGWDGEYYRIHFLQNTKASNGEPTASRSLG
jgi:hypothetical protein